MHQLWENDDLTSVDVTRVQAVARAIWNAPETLEDWCADIGPLGETTII